MGKLSRVLLVLFFSGGMTFVACSSDKSTELGNGTGGKPSGDASTDKPVTDGTAGKPDGSGGAKDSGAGCQSDDECTAQLPTTIPASCAEGKCQEDGTCSFVAVDGDGDGHTKMACKSSDGSVTIELGDDCDDSDKDTYPNAWDGPFGEGQADRCDQLDQDCNGAADDSKLSDGTSCSCKPGDVGQCSEDSQGKPITWPTGTPTGPCKYGGRTCLANGTWGPCADAVPPAQETCNDVDDDCNGAVDDGPSPDKVPVDAPYWAYDADDDLHGRATGGTDGYKPVRSCDPPTTAPSACTSAPLDKCKLGATVDACCPPTAWKLASAIPADDCNDQDKTIQPSAAEKCINAEDDNCNGQVDELCVCNANSVDNTCATTSTGAPITYPGGTPKGDCKYGSRTCAANGQSWGPCNGAVGPIAGPDVCNVTGADTNCDGTSTCSCSGSAQQDCPNQKGSCAGSKQTCSNGTWGTCSVVPKSQDTCQPGNDDSCDGVANNGFASGNTTICKCLNGQQQSCGACNAGTRTCVSGNWDTCIGAPTNIGQPCHVNGNTKGACYNGGTWTCDPSAPGTPKCVPNNANIGTNISSNSAAPNGSYDWNCNGVYDVSMCLPPFPGALSCGNVVINPYFWPNCAGDCNGYIPSYQATTCDYANDQTQCNNLKYAHTCGTQACNLSSQGPICNIGWSYWECTWSAGYCVPKPNSYVYKVSTCG